MIYVLVPTWMRAYSVPHESAIAGVFGTIDDCWAEVVRMMNTPSADEKHYIGGFRIYEYLRVGSESEAPGRWVPTKSTGFTTEQASFAIDHSLNLIRLNMM